MLSPLLQFVRKNRIKEPSTTNCTKTRSADVLIKLRRTYASSFMLERIMALSLCLISAYFAAKKKRRKSAKAPHKH